MQSVVWQCLLNLEFSCLLQVVVENLVVVGLLLLGFSFVYGVFYVLGFGYGKIVIMIWFVIYFVKLKLSIGLMLVVFLLQGLVVIVLVVVVLVLLQLLVCQLYFSSFWLEKGSYLLVGVLGLLLCWWVLKKLCLLLCWLMFIVFILYYVYNEYCGCGYQYFLVLEQLQVGDDWWVCVVIVLLMGMCFCLGVIMVLLFSKVIGVFGWGMVVVLVMVVGILLIIMVLVLLVYGFC